MPLSGMSTREPFPSDVFADVLQGNDDFARRFRSANLPGSAQRGLAIVTCMDSRIDPLAILGMSPGDAKIIRNAGARATEDVIRTLVLATFLLGVTRVLVIPHTDCKMASGGEAEIHAAIKAEHGIDTRSIEIRTVADQTSALITDVLRLRAIPLKPSAITVGGAIYDVHTGKLTPIDA